MKNFRKTLVIMIMAVTILLGTVSVYANPIMPLHHNNDLEKHLVDTIINVDTNIDLTGYNINKNFPDILFKVITQNPLFPKIKEIKYNKNTLFLSYVEDRKTVKEKQEKVLLTAKQIVNSIITPSMTVDQKQMSLYKYLESNSVYDDAAAKYVMANNNKVVPDKYKDSFSAYGVLVNKKGVCGGYAEAYKILMNLAGVPTMIITGSLSNGEPHAWNKVKHGDDWLHVDVTNNFRTTGIPFLVYNANEVIIREIGYKTDNQYWTDYDIDMFNSKTSSKDYYIANKLNVVSIQDLQNKTKSNANNGILESTFRLSKEISPKLAQDAVGEALKNVKGYKGYNIKLSDQFVNIQMIK